MVYEMNDIVWSRTFFLSTQFGSQRFCVEFVSAADLSMNIQEKMDSSARLQELGLHQLYRRVMQSCII
jgi:hypothetical protein